MAKFDADEYDVLLDVREDKCPMPLLKTKLALAKMSTGQVLCVLATDPGSLKDIPYYLSHVQIPLLLEEQVDSVCRFLIQKP
ncbi:sulfurtransferase TusA family protein [Marinomonas sp. MED121]|uniref:sulfurtransferase TusA family protein n=1 Tax=Marinomonas sp. MED121 TaxID=314277 RepID=UPI00030AB03D|nr:sulfurtransferase TusA family protein [Marinomonas sp. MED121]